MEEKSLKEFDLSAVPSDDQGDLARLRRVLEEDYSVLLGRLTHALRSHDAATAALHDAYVRLGHGPNIGVVRNPIAYLYRMALNLANNVRQRELKSLSLPEAMIDGLVAGAPDPERAVLAQLYLERALATLPQRSRDIFLARWRDELGHDEIAARMGLHRRTVQKDLRRIEHLLKASADER